MLEIAKKLGNTKSLKHWGTCKRGEKVQKVLKSVFNFPLKDLVRKNRLDFFSHQI